MQALASGPLCTSFSIASNDAGPARPRDGGNRRAEGTAMQVQTYRKALHLHCCSAMSQRQIARLASISVNTVKRIVSVAQANEWDWAAV